MENEKYCLRLNSFETNIRTTWQQLQNEGHFYDVTLACDDKQIQAHKIILSSSSPVLGGILKSNPSSHPFIYLRGVKYKDLNNLVNFMYQGEINIEEEDLDIFLSTAEDLQVKGLSEQNKGTSHSEDLEKFVSTEKDLQVKGLSKQNEETSYSESYKNDKNSRKQFIDNYDVNYHHNIEKSANEDLTDQRTVKMEANMNQREQILLPAKKTKVPKQSNVVSLKENVSFPCDQCNKLFMWKNAFARHKVSAHEGIRYPCNTCDYKSTTKESLKSHVAAVHEGVRFPCSQCEFTAPYKTQVIRHIKKCHQLQ